MIHNLPEAQNENHDIESVREIIEEIMQVDCTINEIQRDIYTNKPNIYRLGRQADGKSRTLKVHLTSAKLRESIVLNSRRLANSVKYKAVVVQRGLSILERQHLRQLVAEKKGETTWQELQIKSQIGKSVMGLWYERVVVVYDSI